jgi:hypothetical protein
VQRRPDEADGLRVARFHQVVCRFRCLCWGMLKSRPEGFPWSRVASRELTGITGIDLDAAVVKGASDGKENARPTDEGDVDFFTYLAVCDNVDDVRVIAPRPGNATSHDAVDNIAALITAIAAIPGTYRRRVLVRLDGTGFSHKLLERTATGGGIKGHNWEFSVGWACTGREIDAIDKAPRQVRQPGIDQVDSLLKDTWVVDIPPQAGGAPSGTTPNKPRPSG